jgi:magnesium-protoporphyrin IX monomethyl ester (oxidative) cyclase
VFPVTLDIENPAFAVGLERLSQLTVAINAAKAKGGLFGQIRARSLQAAAAATFVRLFFMKAKSAELPAEIRLSPAW